MRNRSLKRQKQEREYKIVKAAYLEEHPYCEAEWMCHGLLAVEIHHKKGRIGDLLCDKKYFLAVCRMCHDRIEQHPKEAKEQGFSLSRLENN